MRALWLFMRLSLACARELKITLSRRYRIKGPVTMPTCAITAILSRQVSAPKIQSRALLAAQMLYMHSVAIEDSRPGRRIGKAAR